MHYSRTPSERWLARFITTAIVSPLIFLGCSNLNPTSVPPTTVINGTSTMAVNPSNNRTQYSFTSSGRNYGRLYLVLSPGGAVVYFEAYGIAVGSGTLAPESMPNSTSPVIPGQSYFIITDTAPHYGRIAVTAVSANSATQTTTVTFNWTVQTVAGERRLE